MSTPFVSGSVALLAGANPGLNGAQLVSRIKATVKPDGQLNGLMLSPGTVDPYYALVNYVALGRPVALLPGPGGQLGRTGHAGAVGPARRVVIGREGVRPTQPAQRTDPRSMPHSSRTNSGTTRKAARPSAHLIVSGLLATSVPRYFGCGVIPTRPRSSRSASQQV